MTPPSDAAMITREEAELIAAAWVAKGRSPGDQELSPVVHEFDLGFVVWGRPPPGSAPLVGAGRGIIDRETGELSVWPSLPVQSVVERFRERRADRPPVPHTWAPADELRRELRRSVTPTTITELALTDQVITARGVKSDARPNLHRLVRAFFAAELAPEHRERGHDRCSEAAALSDALHAEDARRAVAGEDPVTLDQARTGLFAGASLVTYRVREPGDPVAGESVPPCMSCAFLSRHFGFALRAPWEVGDE
jgi:YwqJ-like deaminase